MTVYMPDTDYKAICDAVREKTGGAELLKSGDISVAIDTLEADGIKFILTVTVVSGSTVVASKDGRSVSGVSVGGVCVLTLPEAGEWTVVATLNEDTATAKVVIKSDYTVATVMVDPVFYNNSWENIIRACQYNIIPDTWEIGDEKQMNINGLPYFVAIIDKGHDPYADGSGYAPLTFHLRNCYGVAKIHSSNANSVSWEGCTMRTTTLPSIKALMPVEVQAAIRQVNKLTSAGGGKSSIITTADDLFLLSEVEVFGKVTHSKSGEGSQYAYYAAGNTKIKTAGGAARFWWERSPYGAGANFFCGVSTSGAADYNSNADYGVAFAFCF